MKKKKRNNKQEVKQINLNPRTIKIIIVVALCTISTLFISYLVIKNNHKNTQQETVTNSSASVKVTSDTDENAHEAMGHTDATTENDEESKKKKEIQETTNSKQDEKKVSESKKNLEKETFTMESNGMAVNVVFEHLDDTIKTMYLKYNVNYEQWGVTDKEAEAEISASLGISADQKGIESTITSDKQNVFLDLVIDYEVVDKEFIALIFGSEDDSYTSMKAIEKLISTQGFKKI